MTRSTPTSMPSSTPLSVSTSAFACTNPGKTTPRRAAPTASRGADSRKRTDQSCSTTSGTSTRSASSGRRFSHACCASASRARATTTRRAPSCTTRPTTTRPFPPPRGVPWTRTCSGPTTAPRRTPPSTPHRHPLRARRRRRPPRRPSRSCRCWRRTIGTMRPSGNVRSPMGATTTTTMTSSAPTTTTAPATRRSNATTRTPTSTRAWRAPAPSAQARTAACKVRRRQQSTRGLAKGRPPSTTARSKFPFRTSSGNPSTSPTASAAPCWP
mmetsp:Transcript_41267/g.127444  ORF Transcript_41267/g.127444 Transcript_41267/m.127444 type:complete len:270 (-) Transcript_41267:936-1745(-)